MQHYQPTAEGSSKSVFEALACGLPAITTPNSGTVVRHGVDGYVIDPDDEPALSRSIETLHRDHHLREKMSVNARHRAEEFTWNTYARRVWHLYQTLTAKWH